MTLKLTAHDRTRATNLFLLALVKQRIGILFDYALKVPHRRVPADLRPMADLCTQIMAIADKQVSQSAIQGMLMARRSAGDVFTQAGASVDDPLPDPSAATLVEAKRAKFFDHFRWPLNDHRALLDGDATLKRIDMAIGYLPSMGVRKPRTWATLGIPMVNVSPSYLMPFTGAWPKADHHLVSASALELVEANRHLTQTYLIEQPRQLAQAFGEEAFRSGTFSDLLKVWPGLQPHEGVVCWRKDRPTAASANVPSAFTEETRAALRALAGNLGIAA